MMPEPPADPPPARARVAFLNGFGTAWRSVFAYVLVGNYIGIGALSYEFGFSLTWMVFSTLLIWAAPAQVILISTLTTATLLEVAIAVGLSSARFLPMVAALVPTLKHAHTRQLDLLLPTHLTAISVWVEGMRLLPQMPREQRIPFYNGLGAGLMSSAVLGSVIGHYLAAKLPPLLATTLLFFTPMAILMSAARNNETLIDRLAFGLGLVIAPLLAAQKVKLDLMWTGFIAGTIAYAIHRLREALR
jgi:predicted branched-subunit amino acid permease